MPATATFTCSTALACCFVLSSISRAASVVVPTRSAICLNDVVTSAYSRIPVSAAFMPLSVAMTVVFTALRISSTSVRISFVAPPTRSASLRISSATTPKRPAVIIRTGGSVARVEGESVGLARGLVDDREDPPELWRFGGGVQQGGDDGAARAFPPADGVRDLLPRRAARARGARRVLRD